MPRIELNPGESHRRPASGAALATTIVVTALAVACSTAPPPQSAVISSSGDIEMPTVELRLVVYGYAEEFAGAVEEAADAILASTNDVDIIRNALRWKINIVSASQVAAFSLDPLIGLFDMWVLAVQMRQLFETGGGREAFGPHQSLAIETSRRLESRANEVAAGVSVSGDVSEPRRNVEAYAAARPITDMHFVRETVTKEFASLLGQDRTSGLAVLGDLSMQVGDLSERLKFYAASLPAQIRWQSELLLLNVVDDPEIENFLGSVESIDLSALRLADFADSVPPLLDEQIRSATRAVSEDLAASLREVDRQRIETLNALREERIIVMDQLNAERKAVMEDLAMITDSALGRTTALLDGAVDRAFYRALQLLAVVLAGGLVFAFLLRLMWRRRQA